MVHSLISAFHEISFGKINFLIKHFEFIDQFCPVGIVHQTTRTEQLQRRARYNQKLNARIKYLRWHCYCYYCRRRSGFRRIFFPIYFSVHSVAQYAQSGVLELLTDPIVGKGLVNNNAQWRWLYFTATKKWLLSSFSSMYKKGSLSIRNPRNRRISIK